VSSAAGGGVLRAEWTHDCQGKQDYDADLVQLSTRYWPRGGGFWALNNGVIEDNDARPEIKPAATASILVQGEKWVSADFEGETEAEVKAQVEQWAAAQWARIAAALSNIEGASHG